MSENTKENSAGAETSGNVYSEPVYFYRLQLNTPDPDAPLEQAAMMIGLDGDTPEVLVWPRGESQKGKGPIRARMNTTAFGNTLANMMRKVAAGEPGIKGTLPVLGSRYEEGKSVQKVVANFVCGKRSDGVVVFALFDTDESRSRILFPFTQVDWVRPPEFGGEPISDAELSVSTCNFYADFFERMSVDNALRQTVAERKAFQDAIRKRREERQANFANNRQGGSGGGFQRGNNNTSSSNSNRGQSDFTLG